MEVAGQGSLRGGRSEPAAAGPAKSCRRPCCASRGPGDSGQEGVPQRPSGNGDLSSLRALCPGPQCGLCACLPGGPCIPSALTA